MSHAAQFEERRAVPRTEGSFPAHLIKDGGAKPCEVLNLSSRGVQVSIPEQFAAGDKVSVALDALGTFPGTVVWSDGDRYGIRFQSESMAIWRFLGHTWTCPEHAAGR